MSALAACARPYARALYAYACDHKAVDVWSGYLATWAALLESEDAQRYIEAPTVSSHDKVGLLSESVRQGPRQDGAVMALIALLAGARRLSVLPEIARQYQELVNQHDSVAMVHISSAKSLSVKEKEALEQGLKKVCGVEVIKADLNVDPDLLGGVVCRVGDRVFDFSLKGRLKRFTDNLQGRGTSAAEE